MKIVAIIPAAGAGKRLDCKTAKPYLKLGDKPLLAYSLIVLEKSKRISQIILVVEKKQLSRTKKLIKRFNITKVKWIVPGGAWRSESVRNGLERVDKDTDFVLIHDGARPFITADIIDDCLKAAVKFKAVISGVRCVSTIKQVSKNLNVVSTLDRSILWQVHTPQVFAYKLLKKAYAQFASKKMIFFDDASLMEQLPYKVKVVPGSYNNIKITTADDLALARAILKIK